MVISLYFFGVLGLSAFIYWLIPKQIYRNIVLTAISLGFIAYYDFRAVLMIVNLSVFTYTMAFLIERQHKKKLYHRLGVSGLLIFLVIFKYLGFLTKTLESLAGFLSRLPDFQFERLLLPLGISYIVFKYISYLTDVYWGIIKKGQFFDFLLYGSFFTIYVAGPIERFERFKPQAEIRQKFAWLLIEEGFKRIVFGLFKKLVIADWIGYFIAPVWEAQNNYSLTIRALALLGFSLQIYLDFSGYSDIAIGSSRFFGFKIMENFNWPYLQPNISKFWRNWHVSLSDWIRDYLFFPLSRLSDNRFWLTVLVPLIAMGLCGLWHGPAWHFVLWGLWHGTGLAVLQVWLNFKKSVKRKNKFQFISPIPVLSSLFTFIFVTLGWILFK